MSAARAAILLNRASANARSSRVRRAVERTQAAIGADLHVIDTRNPDDLVIWMEERTAGYDTVVVAGGDGSLSIAYNVLAGRTDVALGYLPAGFGNATARLLNLPDQPDALAELIAGRRTRAVDLVDASGHLALFAGAGWDAVVAERYAQAGARRLIGWGAAIARSLPDLLRRVEVAVEGDGRELHHGPAELVVVSTTPWYGRGLLVNPGAAPDRGRLTLRVYPGPLPDFAVEAARWLTKRRPSVPAHDAEAVVVRRIDGEPLIVQADGDVIGRRQQWRFGVRPSAVQLIGDWR